MREAASPGEVSRLLRRWSSGDKSAVAELMPIVYGELRRLELAAIKARHTQIMELRHLARLTTAQTAEALKVSPATIECDCTFARGRLRRELHPLRGGPGEGLGNRP